MCYLILQLIFIERMLMEEKLELCTINDIRNCIYIIRNQQVMLDYDLARIYGYEVKRLNEQVKRNIERFPDDFMFQLSKEEIPEKFSKSQIATLNERNNRQGTNIKKMPFAFTEQGVYMLATVLKGELATNQSIFIMRAFKEMRHYIKQNRQFVTQTEMNLLIDKIENTTERQNKIEEKVELIQKDVATLSDNFITDKDIKEFVIFKGQKFEADSAYIQIYKQATKSIYVIDDYMSIKTLELLSQKRSGVEVILFTENGHGQKGFLTSTMISDFIKEYPPLKIKSNPESHDRWIIIDYGLSNEIMYHCGASSKDAGNKLCAINKMNSNLLIHPLIDKMLNMPDKTI